VVRRRVPFTGDSNAWLGDEFPFFGDTNVWLGGESRLPEIATYG